MMLCVEGLLLNTVKALISVFDSLWAALITDNYWATYFFLSPGAVTATRCPRGTMRDQAGGTAESDCSPCDGGYYCNSEGSTTPTAKCGERFYCPDIAKTESANPTEYPCPTGSYCPEGTVSPFPCPPGSTLLCINRY